MLVQDLLDSSASKYGNRPALYSREGTVTYAQLHTRSDRIATFLHAQGVIPGDRVALILENSPAFVESYFGVLKAGAVAVPLHTSVDELNMRAFLRHAEVKAAVIQGKLFSWMRKARRDTGFPSLVILDSVPEGSEQAEGEESFLLEEILRNGHDGKPDAKRIDVDLESIVYTSGSTGEPKGVMLTHLNTLSNMRSIAEYFRLTSEDRIMVVLPFSYIYGKSLLLTHFLVGGSVVINNSFMFPNLVLEEIRSRYVTGFAGVPSTFSILLNRSRLRDMVFPALRYMCQAGGSMAPAIQKELMEIIRPARLYIMYGATEAAPRLTYLEPAMLERKLGSIGKAIPNVEVYVADENGTRLPRGEEGEIVARGSNIMPGYWKDPGKTAEVLRNGLYFTGDLGKEDAEGFLYVTGRKRDFIKVKGFRVSTKEIEEILLELNGVQEAAVAGIPDGLLGESVRAFVVASPESALTQEGIRAFVASRLPPYKVPSSIVFLEALPKNSAGKVMKNTLIEEFSPSD